MAEENVASFEDMIYDLSLSWDFHLEKQQYLPFFKEFYKFLNELRAEIRKENSFALDDLIVLVFIVLETLKGIKTNSEIYDGISKIHMGESFKTYAASLRKIKSKKSNILVEIASLIDIIADHFENKVIVFPTSETSS